MLVKGYIATLFLPALLVFFSCNDHKHGFTKLDSSHTNIDFINTLPERNDLNILYYIYFYNGGGVATGDINNDGLPDLYFTANSKGNNKLYLNKGNMKFEDITISAGVAGTADWCTGVTMADVNSDGYLDIYVSAVSNIFGLTGHNELFINDRKGGFVESSAKYGLDFSGYATQAAFFDYDRDGDLDCYILTQSLRPHANIADTSNRRKFDPMSGDRLFRNDLVSPRSTVRMSPVFTDVSVQAGIYRSSLGYGLGLAIADLNNDGWDDIYVGNDFHENDYYYVNNGSSGASSEAVNEVTFTEEGASHFNHYSRFSMGNDVADYNNDGQLDVITVDMLPPDESTLKTYGSDENPDIYRAKLTRNGYQEQFSKNCLQRNNGNGSSFSETGLLSGVSATDWSWSPLFADFDNDGNKDLFISTGIVKRPVDLDYIRFVSDLKLRGLDQTGQYNDEAIDAMPDGSSHPYFFKGDGQMLFKDVSNDWGSGKLKGYFNGASYADLDNDGRLDVVINCINAPAVVLKNNTATRHYLSLSFKGDSLNTSGIGAKAWLFQKNKMQYQQLMPTRGFESSSDIRLHFGLDTLGIDSILIVWPDQKYQVLKSITPDKQVHVLKKDAKDTFSYHHFFRPAPSFFTNITDDIKISWRHRENEFYDNNVQYLIPHAQSTRGPKVAVADVNGDGLDDFYACGAKGQPGALMLQQKDGSFLASDTTVFNAYAVCEEVDAVFFDANRDSFPDLLVVSGGNEAAVNKLSFLNRLFLNNGKGHFTLSEGALPATDQNKSCISVADIDHDGDKDVFIGTLCGSAYGIAQTSYLYINDGKAHFSSAGEHIVDLASIGMVTTAAFADVNNDGWHDLIVAGEWMPVVVFINHNGKFARTDITHSNGLWQAVCVADLNGDGYADIFAGNWGHNTKLHAGKTGAAKLYVKDFDRNGSIEQIMACTINGEEYPFLAKDELERPLPLLKKAYLKYSEVAGKTVQYVMYDLFKDYIELSAEELGSCFFINDGSGKFNKMIFPSVLQLAPIFSFQKIPASSGQNMYISGGNFFDVIPYEGRYDAQSLALFTTAKKDTINYIPQADIEAIKGQVRDIKWLRHGKLGDVLLVARNNEPILFLKFNDSNR